MGSVVSAVINMHLQGAYGALKSFTETVCSWTRSPNCQRTHGKRFGESDAELLMGASEQLCVPVGLGMIISSQLKIITSTHNKRLSH